MFAQRIIFCFALGDLIYLIGVLTYPIPELANYNTIRHVRYIDLNYLDATFKDS
jgi:hypothetical protein